MDTRTALFWACTLCIVAAELLILRSAVRPSAPPQSDTPHDIPQSPRAIEMLWGVLPAIALGALLWAAWRALA